MTLRMVKVLFVCTGNICRSPSAEAVLRHRAEKEGKSQLFHIESAGTHGYHVGESPDPRAVRVAQARGISMQGITARQVRAADFKDFDHIIALDQGHYDILERQQPKDSFARLSLFMDYCQSYSGAKDVPDPYYGGLSGFEEVLDMLEEGVAVMIERLSV